MPRVLRAFTLLALVSSLLAPVSAHAAVGDNPAGPLGLYLEWDNHKYACDTSRPRHAIVVVQWYSAVLDGYGDPAHDNDGIKGRDNCDIATIKKVNPGAKVLAYLDISFTKEHEAYVEGTPSSCVTRKQAIAHEKAAPSDSWFLSPSQGHTAKVNTIEGAERIVADAFATSIPQPDGTKLLVDSPAADVGGESYREACAERLGQIAAAGFTGVFLDDTLFWGTYGYGQLQNTRPTPCQPSETPPCFTTDETVSDMAKYRTDQDYAEAMIGLARGMAAKANTLGLYTLPNVGASQSRHDAADHHFESARRLLAPTDVLDDDDPDWPGAPADGHFQEFFLCWNECSTKQSDGTYVSNRFLGWDWAWNTALMRQAETLGRDFIAQTVRHADSSTADTARTADYAQATFWLSWDGDATATALGSVRSAWSFWDNRDEAWARYSVDLGKPLTAAQKFDGNRDAYECLNGCVGARYYTRGVALVNASAAPHTFTLNASYRRPDTGSWVTSATLQPGTGMVLSARNGASYDGDHHPDVAYLNAAGALSLLPGVGRRMTGIDDAANDHFFSAQGDLKAGWSTSYARTLSPGDLDRDGHADILTINAAGTMQFHGGTGNTATTGGLKAPVTGGSGWGALDQVSGAGNFDGDVNGRIDLLAREKATGKLFLYPGLGTGKFATRVEVGGTTWNTYNLLVGTLDFNGDKYPDLIARKPDGTLWMFRGNGSGAGQFISTTPTSLGSGWQQFSSLLAPGDFDGDGRADLLARRATDGKGLIYPGTGGVSGYFLPLRPLRVVAVPSTWLAIAGS